jgi:hypothetical protein
LIRKEFDREDSLKIRSPQKVAAEGFGMLLTKLTFSTGIQREEHLVGETRSRRAIRKDTPRAHAFRIFFNTTMIQTKVNAEAREMLMGHTLGLNDAYYKPSSSDILAEYLKTVDALTINEEYRLKHKVEELTNKTKDNEYIIKAKLQERETEVQELKERYEQDMKAIRQEMESKFQQMLSRIDMAKLG